MKKREKHGMSKTTEYQIWAGAKSRCNDPNHEHYSDYGGRGITMHDSWESSFSAFFEYMGPRPKGHELDRIDNQKGYEPGNVRWVSHTENVRNRRNTVRINYKNEVVLLVDYAKLAGLTYGTAWSRAKRTPDRLDGGEQRRRRGQDHHKSKITNAQADEIRTSKGKTSVLASKFNVSCSLINQIRRCVVRKPETERSQ